MSDGEIDTWTLYNLDAQHEAMRLLCCALVRHLALASPQPSRHFAVNFFAGVTRELHQEHFLPARRDQIAGTLAALSAQVLRHLPGGADADRPA